MTQRNSNVANYTDPYNMRVGMLGTNFAVISPKTFFGRLLREYEVHIQRLFKHAIINIGLFMKFQVIYLYTIIIFALVCRRIGAVFFTQNNSYNL